MIDIAVIDSMIDLESETTDSNRLKIYGGNDEKIVYGHGNAVCGLLFNANKEYYVHLFVVNKNSKFDHVSKILNYILSETKIKYICMSCGFINLNRKNINDLRNICANLFEDGRILVVANSNDEKYVTYPARFNTVVCVDKKDKRPDWYWKYIKSDEIKICWRKNLFIVDDSNSFHVPLVVDFIIKNKLEKSIIERLNNERN